MESTLLRDLLKQVSRSFYLTLRVLPAAVRPQIGIAYLFARATDTIADSDIVPVPRRVEALGALREAILNSDSSGVSPQMDFGDMSQRQASPAERILLERMPEAITLLHQFSPADQYLIREVLSTITSGQELDLARFRDASHDHIQALRTEEELDDYTYRVAGCVGEFWTKICHAHLFPTVPVDAPSLLKNGIRFGKGLQLVNILRDLPADLRKGRCYIPASSLTTWNLTPTDLLSSRSYENFRVGYEGYLARAEAHLAAGWAYTNALPRKCRRVRLACAWPILIGLRTIDQLRDANPLDHSRRIKVPRTEVRKLIMKSILLYPFPSRWRALAR